MTEWERCKHWIEDAIAYNGRTMTIDDVEAGIVSGKYQFLPDSASAMVIEIADLPRKKLVNFLLAGGDLNQLQKAEQKVTKWARQVGLDGAMIIGRRGWGKALEGYKEAATVYMKEF